MVVVAVSCALRSTAAQLPAAVLPLSNTEDARTLRRGELRLRAINAWTRIDEVYDSANAGAKRLRPLGAAFSTGQLGVREIPSLSRAEAALRTLTANPSLSLDAGQTVATADSRIVTTPISLEYGVTDRLTLGATVPVVQTHTTLLVELNPKRLGDVGANVGPNPAQLGNTAARGTNAGLIASLGDAVTALQNYVAGCSSSGGCAPASVDQANRLITQASDFRGAVTDLYGTDETASLFAPLGTTQASIVANLGNLQNTINSLLGSSFTFAAPVGANAPAALQQLRQLATAVPGIGYDSLGSPDRINIGDVEISAAYKLLDSFDDSTRSAAFRSTLRGVARLGTGSPSRGLVPFEVGTGTGQTSADIAAIFDVRFARRMMTTLTGVYTAYFTRASIPRLPNSDYALFPLDEPVPGTWREGNALQIEATPRVLLTEYFTFHGAYALRHQAAPEYAALDGGPAPTFAATTEQRLGLGFVYSTLARYARGRSSIPFELFFTHLETIAARGGLVPKYHRDQIEFRIYYRLFRPGR